MGFSHGSKAALYLTDVTAAERNMTPFIEEVGFPPEADTSEVSTLGNTFKAYVPGLKGATLTGNGFMDPVADGYFWALLGDETPRAFKYYPMGSPGTMYSGVGILTKYEPNSSVGDANKFSFEVQITGTVTRT